MKIEVTITQGTEEGLYNVRYKTSMGSNQERYKDKTSEEAAKILKDMIEENDAEGRIGRK